MSGEPIDAQVRVKVCGITCIEDALMAARCGADALGFFFYAGRPRCVRPQDVKRIVAALPPFITTVGLFVNEDPSCVAEILDICGLDVAQLHGDEAPVDCVLPPHRVIKAFRVQDQSSLSILENISFTINQGEAVAIVGASGSGKSTLLGMLAGLDIPSGGAVRFLGQDLTKLNEDKRASLRAEHVGFVFQSFQLLDHLSALENVMLATELTPMPNREKACKDMLERVGLGDRLNHTPKTLSGGEQQRVALARAFVRKPTIVFADEPTGSLDFATGQRIIDLMFELQNEQGTTLILVTHDEKLAARCSRQLTIAAGALVQELV